MHLPKVTVIFSILLVTVNISFLYIIVAYKELIARQVAEGLTIGILGFASVIVFTVILTWIYVTLANKNNILEVRSKD